MHKKVSIFLDYFASSKKCAAAINLVIAAIVITPLCGLLFQCGCNWPWNGLNDFCNYYHPEAIHKCPWCSSLVSGLFSCSISILAGIWVSISDFPSTTGKTLISRLFSGFFAFLIMAALTAIIAAYLQDYPEGIGGLVVNNLA